MVTHFSGALTASIGNYTTTQRDALFTAVLNHDDIYDDARLPKTIPIASHSSELFDCFSLAAKLFLELESQAEARRFIDELLLDPAQTASSICRLKHARARFKHLQFTMSVCGAAHRYPRLIHAITVLLGEIQDALRHDTISRARRLSLVVKSLLGNMGQVWIELELRSFRISSMPSYRRHLGTEVEAIENFLRLEQKTAHNLHNARKAISRLMAHYDALTLLKPSLDRVATARFISTLNGLMGGYHDELVSQKLTGVINYKRDNVPIPDIQRMMLMQLSSGLSETLGSAL